LTAQAVVKLISGVLVFISLTGSYTRIGDDDAVMSQIANGMKFSAFFVLITSVIFAAGFWLSARAIKKGLHWGKPVGGSFAIFSMGAPICWPLSICALYFMIPDETIKPIEKEIKTAWVSSKKQ
jgi:uncharacterized membrane protein